jgi:hypothetical protein
MIIENGTIDGNTISINPELENKVFLPSMYESWGAKKDTHINFTFENTDDSIPSQNKILFIFDTWGCSSYYHLLIDHIIPVWITKQYVTQYLLEQNVQVDMLVEDYLRISNNNYINDLSNTNEIFSHFLGKQFTEQINGKFKYIVYGYCFFHRPFHGTEIKYYPNYQKMIDKFLLEFVKCSRSDYVVDSTKEQYIILVKRETRSFVDIDIIFDNLTKFYNVKIVDFSKHSIQEQIELCSNAYAMVGCEGAGFANQVFMKPGSLIISITQQICRNNFHISLTQYLKHDFRIIDINNSHQNTINEIIRIIDSPRTSPQIPVPTIY